MTQDTKQLLLFKDISGKKEIVMILKRIVERIRKAWPHVGIIVRGDSHYGCPNHLKIVLILKKQEVSIQ